MLAVQLNLAKLECLESVVLQRALQAIPNPKSIDGHLARVRVPDGLFSLRGRHEYEGEVRRKRRSEWPC